MNIFISGGSQGIGKATVLHFLEKGHHVAFSYNSNRVEAEKTLQLAQEKFPTQKVRAYKLDVRIEQEVETIGEQVLEDFTTIDSLICNAGIANSELLITHSTDTWNNVLQTNLTGTFFLCRFFLSPFLENRKGSIVLMSSLNRHGASGLSAYATSKAGLIGLSQSIAKEYGAKGIRCNVVSPGYIETELTSHLTELKSGKFFLATSPLKRAGLSEEVASAIYFLASSDSSFVNGSEVTIDGGLRWMP